MKLISLIDKTLSPLRRPVLAAALGSMAVCALAESPDSLKLGRADLLPDSLPSFMIPAPEAMNLDNAAPGLPSADIPSPLSSDYGIRRLEPFRFSYSPVATLASWRTGSVAASGSQESMLGLMATESGRISIGQSLGPLTLTAWAGAMKVGYFRGLQTAYGFGGEANYEISDRWSVTVFGQYYTPLHPLTPAMAGYFPTSNFGGYASYNINDRWGISVGAQATRSLVTNRWEAQPIVTPYYRINKKVSIGVDVGGIIYNLAKDYLESRNNNWNSGAGSAPPPIGPAVPRPAPARVAPRR